MNLHYHKDKTNIQINKQVHRNNKRSESILKQTSLVEEIQGHWNCQKIPTYKNIQDLLLLVYRLVGMHQQPFEPKYYLFALRSRSRHEARNPSNLSQARKVLEAPYDHTNTEELIKDFLSPRKYKPLMMERTQEQT